jgi:hypothetical protein
MTITPQTTQEDRAAKLSGGRCIIVVTILLLFAEPGRTIVYRDQRA